MCVKQKDIQLYALKSNLLRKRLRLNQGFTNFLRKLEPPPDIFREKRDMKEVPYGWFQIWGLTCEPYCYVALFAP